MVESHREEIAKLEALYASNPGGRVFVHLAEALRRAGEHERARAILDEGLARHGDSASGYVVRGRVLLDLGESDQAIGAFHRVLELDPGNLVALRGLGDAAQRTGSHDAAVRYYAELLSRSPFDEEIRGLLTDAEGVAAAARAPETGPTLEPAGEDEPYREWPMPGPEAAEAVSEPAAAADQPAAPYSAAPGTSGDDAVAAEPDFGLIDIEQVTGEIPAAHASAFLIDDDDAGPSPDVSDLFEIPSDASLADVRLEGGPDADGAEYAEFDVELELARAAAAQPEEVEPAPGPAGDLDIGSIDEVPLPPHVEQESVQPSEPSAADLLAAEMRQWGRRGETDTDAGLVTETMADLYLSQGFHERAAEVYRTLLQRRPDDAALAAKLAAAQSARTGAAALEAGEEWLRGTVWTAEQATQDAPTPYTWTSGEPEEEAEVAQPIGEYLRSLLAWRAGAAGTETQDAAEAGSWPAAADTGWIDADESSAWEQGPYETAYPNHVDETEHAAEGGWSQIAGDELGGGWTPESEAWSAGADDVEEDAAELWSVELDAGGDPYGRSDLDASAGSDAAAEVDPVGFEEDEPATDTQPAAPSSEAAAEPWSFEAESPADEPWSDTGAAAGPWAGTGEASAEVPVEEPREDEAMAADPWSAESQPAGGDPWSEGGQGGVDSEVEPWSATPEPDQWTPPTPATEAAAADLTSAAGTPPRRDPNSVETAFEEWYGGGVAEPKPDTASERQRQEEEDEDLAMFRAWLQSLKK